MSLFALWCYIGWLHEEKTEKEAKKEENESKEEDEQFSLSTISGGPPYNSFWTPLVLLCTGAAYISCLFSAFRCFPVINENRREDANIVAIILFRDISTYQLHYRKPIIITKSQKQEV